MMTHVAYVHDKDAARTLLSITPLENRTDAETARGSVWRWATEGYPVDVKTCQPGRGGTWIPDGGQ